MSRAVQAARPAAWMLLAISVLGCGASGPTFPPAGSTPARPYRPPEGALMTGAARSVLQATLPDDPDHGYIVIYSLGSAVAAESAAFDQARYIASGPGAIQFPPGSHFVLRIVGSTVIFFTWNPGSAPDTRTHLIEDALNTLGVAVPVGS